MTVLLALLGVALLGISSYLIVMGLRARSGVIVEGTVVNAVRRGGVWTLDPGIDQGMMRTARTYAPVVEYKDANGGVHYVTPKLSNGRRPQIGGKLRVAYRPDAPDKGFVLNAPGQATAKYAFAVIGIALIIGAAISGGHH